MAGNGPPPKDPAQRRRRNAERREELPAEGAAEFPPLPPMLDGSPYPEQVSAWYCTWATSPQATRFLATDWQRLHLLAPLVMKYLGAPSKELAAELRLQESLLGATVVDRMRLRWDVTKDEAEKSDGRRQAADVEERRRRLRVV